MSGDDREREKLSWAEIDRRRDGARPRDDGPGGFQGRQERERRSREALAEADQLFSGDGDVGGAEGAELAKAVRDAHGTPGLVGACRAYADVLGIPSSTELLSIFLDTSDRTLMLPALERLYALKQAGRLEVKGGLKSQLRVLAQEPDDDIAGLSEDLLA